MSQPSAATFVSLRKWVRKQRKQDSQTSLRETAQALAGLPPEVQTEVLKHAISVLPPTRQKDLAPDEVMDVLSEPDGAAFLFWLLARDNHPDTTPDTFRKHLDDTNVDGVLADLLEATGLADLDPNVLTGGAGSLTVSPAT